MTPPLLIELARRLNNRRVLVTGATGGIGRRLVQALTAASVPTRILVRDASRAGTGRAEVAVGDLTKPETLIQACDRIQLILHLGSYSPAPEDPEPEEHPLHQEVTLGGTRNLLQAATDAGIERILFASSSRVLDGSGSLYAKSKREAETLLAQSGLSSASLRLPPVYGFRHRGFIMEMVEKIRAGRLPPLPDFGDRRSLIHLDDAVQALLLAAGNTNLTGNWTVTDLETYSMRRIDSSIRVALGKRPAPPLPPLLFQVAALGGEVLQRLLGRTMPLDLPRLKKLQQSAWFDGSPFAETTGFTPLHTLESALPQMLEKPAQADQAS